MNNQKTYENVLISGSEGYIGSFLKKAFPGAFFIDEHDSEYPVDICDISKLNDVESGHSHGLYQIDTVIHAAAYVSASQSVEEPSLYYYNNVVSTLNLLHLFGDKTKFIFLSSVMAEFPEANPYADSKRMCENLVEKMAKKYAILRLNNIAGASFDGELGPNRINPTHLIEILARELAKGDKTPTINIYGTDYPTDDGTAEKIYVHPDDVVNAVRMAILRLNTKNVIKAEVSSPNKHTVKHIISLFEDILGVFINTKLQPRRPGDFMSKSRINFGDIWTGKIVIEDIIKSAYNYERFKNNV